MPTREFISMIALFFSEPSRLVLGKETANAARDRFGRAVEQVMRGHAESSNVAKNIAVVTHGTVMALFLADRVHKNAFDLWRLLQLPSYATIDWPSGKVGEVVERL